MQHIDLVLYECPALVELLVFLNAPLTIKVHSNVPLDETANWEALLANRAQLQSLVITAVGCMKHVFHVIARYCQCLKRLIVCNCMDIDDAALEQMAHHCPLLTDLHLGHCSLLAETSHWWL